MSKNSLVQLGERKSVLDLESASARPLAGALRAGVRVGGSAET